MGYSRPVKYHVPCERCNSSDAVTIYEHPDGFEFAKCFSCDAAYTPENKENNNGSVKISKIATPEELQEYQNFDSSYRNLTPETLEFYGIKKSGDDVVFPFYDYNNELTSAKIRYPNKQFTVKNFVVEGFQKSGLFGHHKFPHGGKYITVTSGEYDAPSAYQMMGSKYPCVSLKNGDNSVLTQEDFDYLNKFDQVIFCGDSDEPGRKCARKFALNFAKDKCKVVFLSKAKDANDYLQAKGDVEFVNEWWKAKAFTPEGLIQGKDTLSSLLEDDMKASIPYPWDGLQNLLHGIRTSELVVVTAGSGVGKSEVVKELALHIFKADPNARIGCLFLEEAVRKSVRIFTGMELEVNLRLPENKTTDQQKSAGWARLFDNDRWLFWDHFGSNDINDVCNQVRFIANNFGAKYIFLDHVSIIVSDGQAGDERKALDAIMTKLRTLVQKLDISLFLVSHLRRTNDAVPHEEGGVTSLSQLRGSAGIGQLADIVIGLERNGQADNKVERNITTLRILKNRITGETGPAAYLQWIRETGRLHEIDNLDEVGKLIAAAAEEQKFEERGLVNQGI